MRAATASSDTMPIMTLRILIVDDEPAARFGMTKALARIECQVSEAADGRAALDAIWRDAPDLVFLDLNMPVMDGMAVLRELGDGARLGEIIVVTANDAVGPAVECMRLGATDYITKPFELERIRGIARRNAKRVALERQVGDLRGALDQKTAFGSLVGVSRAMRELFAQLERAAKAPLDVLVLGETGTGKELIAREIHRLSGRGGPFIAVNTAAINATLAESELFGHVKGAFTGADGDRKGVFEQAHGGMLFLDEIGDMPLPLQAKMLRVLQQRTVQRVGSAKDVPVDVRVVSATHQDLTANIAEGHFRQDLYFRIRGIELSIPPLRRRPEDIALLADFFLDRFASRQGGKSVRLEPGAVEALLRHTWPGNVRELEHCVTAAVAMATGESIGANDLSLGRTPAAAAADPLDFNALNGLPLTEAKAKLIDRFERHAIRSALVACEGNVSAAARQLGIHRQNLQQKMLQLDIQRQ